MRLDNLEPFDVRPHLIEERDDLIRLLSGLTTEEWHVQTAASNWDVKAVALHLLDDDLGWLSRHRDRDTAGRRSPEDFGSFVDALNAKNQQWVDGTRGLSPRVITELLAWSGHEMNQWWATIDLTSKGRVIWASDDEVPQWFDIAQDLTERWVHQMQIREAVNRVEEYSALYLPIVLKTFVWAIPHQYRVPAPVGTCINIHLGLKESWHLQCIDQNGLWELHANPTAAPAATLKAEPEAAWRMLTGAPYNPQAITLDGDPTLTHDLLNVRGIIV